VLAIGRHMCAKVCKSHAGGPVGLAP
jgi:hypothetical protein